MHAQRAPAPDDLPHRPGHPRRTPLPPPGAGLAADPAGWRKRRVSVPPGPPIRPRRTAPPLPAKPSHPARRPEDPRPSPGSPPRGFHSGLKPIGQDAGAPSTDGENKNNSGRSPLPPERGRKGGRPPSADEREPLGSPRRRSPPQRRPGARRFSSSDSLSRQVSFVRMGYAWLVHGPAKREAPPRPRPFRPPATPRSSQKR